MRLDGEYSLEQMGFEFSIISIIDAGGDEAVDQDSSSVRSERGAETINVTQMEMCRPGNVIDVRMERKCAVEDDTQTLTLGGGGHCGVVYGEGETVNFG